MLKKNHSNRPPPKIIKNIFTESDLEVLRQSFKTSKKSNYYDPNFGRLVISELENSVLSYTSKLLTPLARKTFKSKTLVPSYALFVHYYGNQANLFKHKDDNACTYTLDFCLYQKTPWDIWVEDKPYTLKENEALAFYGNDQLHWREEFPDPKRNKVGMIFFHFVEPEHWYYTKGPIETHNLKNKERRTYGKNKTK